MATDQDFSFPTIHDSFSNYSIDSPPLWNLSPATSPNPYGGEASSFNIKDSNEEEEGKRRSLSCIEIHGRRRIDFENDDDDDDEKEKKMDLLWENFNEELLCSTSRTTTTTTTTTSASTSRHHQEEVVELRKVAKRRSNNNHAALLLPTNKNKPGMVVFVKVLKKLFSLTNSQAKPRKRVVA